MALRICGPKLSNCCFVLSLWGVIMLVGICRRSEVVALVCVLHWWTLPLSTLCFFRFDDIYIKRFSSLHTGNHSLFL